MSSRPKLRSRATKVDPTPGRAAHNWDFGHESYSLSAIDGVLGNPPRPGWHKGAYVSTKTSFQGHGFELVLNPDGTYFLNDTSG